ncbi:MAG: beta-lactamase family protein [Candidatus Eremiobacteraeota bacterium]|nr:beta-lactamase family protein [Candidatus Eremiobacteraeota bacterium]
MDRAIEYSRAHGLQALLIDRGGDAIAQEYAGDLTAGTPHALYSGTKSFWGVAALAARADGLLELEEPVAETIESWRDDAWKRRVTIRMLLSLTAGFGFGGLGASVPTYDAALAMTLKDEPGTRFTYGGIPLQVFGAVLARKLAPQKLTPHEYLRERVLEPADVHVDKWRELSDGTHPLPTGAYLSARAWLAYGRFILTSAQTFAACFEGSAVNARYGLGWWLGAKDAPADLVYASGSGGQALYLVRSLGLAVVVFSASRLYRHEAFLKRLFSTPEVARRSPSRTRHSARQ